MTKRARAAVVVAAVFLIGQAPSAQRGPGGPMRIILLVDSSAAVSSMIPQFRAGLADFLDELPGDPQIAIVTTGGSPTGGPRFTVTVTLSLALRVPPPRALGQAMRARRT